MKLKRTEKAGNDEEKFDEVNGNAFQLITAKLSDQNVGESSTGEVK